MSWLITTLFDRFRRVSVSTPDARTIAIQPWDRHDSAIEKRSWTPILDLHRRTTVKSSVARFCLTEERRRDLIKRARAAGENSKVAVRNIRRDAVDSLKKGEKNGDFSEDVQREGETEVQKVTDSNTKAIDELVAAKEKEIMTV